MDRDFLADERVVLEFKKFAQAMALDAGIMAEMNLSVDPSGYNFMRDQVMVRMVTKLLTDDLPPEHVTQSTMIKVREPKSTWQMWKFQNGHHWFARWFVDRRPVKYREYEKSVQCEFNLERYRAYPRARVQSPALGNAVMFHTIRDVQWDV